MKLSNSTFKKKYKYRVALKILPVFKEFWEEMPIFVQSVKTKMYKNVEIDYSLNLKTLEQKLNPTQIFEK